MKKLLLLFFLGVCSVLLHAETVNVPTAGTLSAQLTAIGINSSTVTNLTITGNLNSTDLATLKTMATSNSLGVLDLSGATVSGNTIPEYAFQGCGKLTAITLPNTVTAIGMCALSNCTRLTSITIPNSVTSIGIYAFSSCTGLTSITIPNSVTSIGSYAFNWCTGLTSITLPNSVTTIGSSAFFNCTKLTSVTIPNSVTTIGSSAFSNCTSLTAVNVPSSVTSIGDGVLTCPVTVDADNQNYSAEDGVLFNKDKTILIRCPISKIGYTIPNTVISISKSAFSSCTNLTSLAIPNSVKTIGDEAFWGCSKLTSVAIPNSVTSIGSYAFQKCSGLTSITIPNSLTSIGYCVFSSCTNLTSVAIPNSITTISSDAFRGCTKLTSVTIPNSVTSIGSSAFSDCRGLTSLTIPNSVTSIGYCAFQNCTGLTSVTIPNSVTSIGYSAFSSCTNLTSVAIPNSVKTIGDEAFWGCSKLTSVAIPNSVTAIGTYAFSNCYSLNSVTIPSSVTAIGSNAFSSCSPNLIIKEYSNNPSAISLAASPFTSPAGSKVLHVPLGSKTAYEANGWGSYFTITDDLPASGTLTVTPAAISFLNTASSATITVTSNIHWGAKILTGADWLSVSPYSADASSNTLTLTAAANMNAAHRTATITVATYDGAASQAITVTQYGTLPVIATQAATSVATTTATGNGNLAYLGTTTTKQYGICYSSTNTTPTIADSKVDNGAATATGPFTASLTSLTPGTLYYARAYATNDAGTTYGDVVSFTTSKIQLSIADPVLSAKEYDGTTDASWVILPGALKGTLPEFPTVTVSVASATFDTKKVGVNKTVTLSYAIIDGADMDKYIAPVNTVVTTGVITPKDLTIANTTAQNKAYDGNVAATVSGATLNGVVSGDIVNLTLGTATFADANAGNNKGVTISGSSISGADASNYSLTELSGLTANITAQTITVTADDNQTKVYGNADPTFTYTVSPALLGSDAFSGSLTRVAGENVGNYAIAQGTLSAGSNYSLSFVSKDFTITAKPVTVTADANQTKVYGNADPTFTYTVSPVLVGSDAFSGSLTRVVGENVGSYTIAQGTLTAGSNYALSFVSKDFSITPKTVTVTANTSQSKIYGDTDPTFTYTVSPALVGSDVFTGSLTRTTGENVGNYAIAQGTLEAGSNYNLSFIGNDFSITGKQLTITPPTVVTSKMYDGTTSVTITSLGKVNGIISADASSVSVSGMASYNDPSAGDGRTITVTYTLNGNSTRNYLAPASEVIGGARILEKVTLAALKSPQTGCQGSYLDLDYSVLAGEPVRYQVVFGEKAIAAGFSNNGYTVLPSGTGGVISILVPSGLAEGVYSASLQMVNELNDASVLYPFTFSINLSSDYIITKFNDVVLCKDVSNRFTAYQWYKNGTAIIGATKQFYNDPQGLSGTYSVQVVTVSGETLMSCGKTIALPASSEVALTVFPNPVSSNQSCTLKISGLSDDDLRGTTLSLYSLEGLRVYHATKVEQLNTLSMKVNSGVYMGHLITVNNKKYTFKVVVVR